MISVTIFINGSPILTRSAVNRGPVEDPPCAPGGPLEFQYEVDDGSTVHHYPKDGAVVLAKKLLDTIKEQTSC